MILKSILKKKVTSGKLQAASFKQQASSLTATVGYDRINLERSNYEQ